MKSMKKLMKTNEDYVTSMKTMEASVKTMETSVKTMQKSSNTILKIRLKKWKLDEKHGESIHAMEKINENHVALIQTMENLMRSAEEKLWPKFAYFSSKMWQMTQEKYRRLKNEKSTAKKLHRIQVLGKRKT